MHHFLISFAVTVASFGAVLGQPSGQSCTARCGDIIPDGQSGSPSGSNWCNQCRCDNGLFLICTLIACETPEPACPPKKSCTTACGETVEHGQRASPGGDNWCNECECNDGEFGGCTEAFCIAPPPACPPKKSCTTACGETVEHGQRASPGGDNWCNECECNDGEFGGCTEAFCIAPPPACPPKKSCTARCGQVIPHGQTGSPSGNDWCNGCQCDDGEFTICTEIACGPEPTCAPKKDCKTSCGNTIKHGQTASDDGDNFCNDCTCDDGALSCTEKGCPAAPTPTCLSKNSRCAVKRRRTNRFILDRRTECPDNTTCEEVRRTRRNILFNCVEN